MKRRRSLKAQPRLRVRQRMVYWYAVGGITLALLGGVGVFFYINLSNSTTVVANTTGTISPLGADIDGEASDDESGKSVALSLDGNRLAVGAPLNDGNGSKAGQVRVYEWKGSTWQQLGNDIDGEAVGDELGSSVSLSSDGSRLVVGAPLNDDNGSNAGQVRVYEWNGSVWQQLGNDIDGEASGDRFGVSVSLSSDGNRLAAGAHLNNGRGGDSGHVRVYGWNGSAWQQLGSDINGEASGIWFGIAVSLSADGNRVAGGAHLNDGSGTDAGHVRVYEWNGSAWQQLGSDIDGEESFERTGRAVSLSSDGNRLAAGAYNNSNGAHAGQVRMYEWDGSSWQKIGSDIEGEANNDWSGFAVSLSSDGSRVAAGAYQNDGNGSDAGHVRVYEWDGSSWYQIDGDIDGEAAGDQSGIAVSLSSDGSRLAVGAPQNDGGGSNAGHARVYELPTTETLDKPTGPGGVGNANGSPNQPENALWLDAARGVTVSGSAISTWEDQSGNGFVFGQLDTENLPLFTTNGLASGNYAAVRFDGTKRYLALDDHDKLDNSLSGLTILTVFQSRELDGSPRAILSKRNSSSSQESYSAFTYSSNRLFFDVRNTQDNRHSTTNSLSENTDYVAAFRFDGTSQRIRVQGIDDPSTPRTVSGSGPIDNGTAPLILGALNKNYTYSFDGDVAEVLIYRKALNAAQLVIVENYLAAKYGLTLGNNDVYTMDEGASGNYDHEVAGIGRVDATNQHTDAQGSGIVRMLNADDLDDDEFLLWGHENGAMNFNETVNAPSGANRLERVWRVSEVNTLGSATDVGSVDLRFDLSTVAGFNVNNLYLLMPITA